MTITANSGGAGADGTQGLDSASGYIDGGNGGNGDAGGAASDVVVTPDAVDLDTPVAVTGGAGGDGGDGGDGASTLLSNVDGVSTFIDSSAGDAGNGGAGGTAGAAELTAQGVFVSHGLDVTVRGGVGGAGGDGGTGGIANPESHTSYVVQNGGHGGMGGIGGAGAAGGNASLTLSDIVVSGGTASLRVWGGAGGAGGHGGTGNSGAAGGDGHIGGLGGDGGSADLSVSNLTAGFDSGSGAFTLDVRSGAGGAGGAGGDGAAYNLPTVNTPGVGGQGGDGGTGGSASLNFSGNHLTGTAADETLHFDIHLEAMGGGQGGAGGGSGMYQDGSHAMADDGYGGGGGTTDFIFQGNVIDGGAGSDTLDFHLSRSDTWEDGGNGMGNVTVDLASGAFTMGWDNHNTIAGVENVTLDIFDSFYLYSEAIQHVTLNGDNQDNVLRVMGFAENFIHAGGGNDTLSGGTAYSLLDGGTGSDTADYSLAQYGVGIDLSQDLSYDNGRGGYDQLVGIENLHGSDYADTLTGSTGANILDGAAGSDTLIGGFGDDTYYVDNAGDVVREGQNQGTDTVHATVSYSLAGQFIENLVLDGSGDINATGNSLANVLTGNSGSNTLDGGYGNDVLDGGAGADAMYGGGGDDTYVVDNGGDHVYEGAGSGTDTVLTSVSFSLAGQQIENLTLTGTDNLNATGNSLANILTGNSGANTLDGGYGNDRLDGGAGADSLYGGTGDDTFTVDNVGDHVYENNGEGTDTVLSSVSFSLSGQFIENLTLTGSDALTATGNGLANILTGNSGSNVLDGGYGADSLTGGAGADMFLFKLSSGADTITDFSAADGDSIKVHAFSQGVAHAEWIVQNGSDVVIDLGGGNSITVLHATAADVSAHMVW